MRIYGTALELGLFRHTNRQPATYVPIDGRHRIRAAVLHPNVTDVGVMLFHMSEEDEARAYLACNTGKKVNVLGKHVAKVQYKDPVALEVDAMINGSGRHFEARASQAGATNITCPGVLENMVRRALRHTASGGAPGKDKLIFDLALRVCKNRVFDQKILSGLFDLELRLKGISLSESPWCEILEKELGAVGLLNAIKEEVKYQASRGKSSGGKRAWGEGILNAINHRDMKSFRPGGKPLVCAKNKGYAAKKPKAGGGDDATSVMADNPPATSGESLV